MGMKRDDFTRYSRHVTRGPRWKALRMAVLERDGFRCKSCGARGRLEVDHIQPVRSRPDLAYAPDNLQALCPACHTSKTRIECGHPPPDPARQQWQAAVSDLERHHPNRARKDKTCSIL